VVERPWQPPHEPVELAEGVGRRIQVLFDDTSLWFCGVVLRGGVGPARFFVKFDDGQREWIYPEGEDRGKWRPTTTEVAHECSGHTD